jgi:hypothetical protein
MNFFFSEEIFGEMRFPQNQAACISLKELQIIYSECFRGKVTWPFLRLTYFAYQYEGVSMQWLYCMALARAYNKYKGE